MSSPTDTAWITEYVLPLFGLGGATVAPLGQGLINQTFLVTTGDRQVVLQRLSPIFDARIHRNIEAVTAQLATVGIPTPRLVSTTSGGLWADLAEGGIWRAQTFLTGASFDKPTSESQVHSASILVGRFHQALVDLPHAFEGLRQGVHDTPKHLRALATAGHDHEGHPLRADVTALAREIFANAGALPPLPDLPPMIGHGDLKLNNVIFAGPTAPEAEQAQALIDLDTVGPQALAFELGDAWRSWCNQSGEDATEAVVDLDLFEASLDGYAVGVGRALSAGERKAMLLGPEWVALELSARFAADALHETYFGWNPKKYASRGEHNLVRARGQFAVHKAFLATRDIRAKVLGI